MFDVIFTQINQVVLILLSIFINLSQFYKQMNRRNKVEACEIGDDYRDFRIFALDVYNGSIIIGQGSFII